MGTEGEGGRDSEGKEERGEREWGGGGRMHEFLGNRRY